MRAQPCRQLKPNARRGASRYRAAPPSSVSQVVLRARATDSMGSGNGDDGTRRDGGLRCLRGRVRHGQDELAMSLPCERYTPTLQLYADADSCDAFLPPMPGLPFIQNASSLWGGFHPGSRGATKRLQPGDCRACVHGYDGGEAEYRRCRRRHK
ncbi:hypothetical protein FA95DRAFT_507633 [Auriscalpium vulgare]|uniref:Uncharacterized protein n=1 Tax=Auriscalpium vulgare TaxID=40419 RepID=A0ACB8RFT4_9AGAM|nr:hypothetical protein FA95DRAFT_507633 [Auriscalpium vulgare]